jgi:hypothetical protein
MKSLSKEKKPNACSVEIWSQKQHLTERMVKNLSALTKRKQFVSQPKMFDQTLQMKGETQSKERRMPDND